MVALASLLVIITLYLLIERTATVALTLTGPSRDAAQFQTWSAFTGTGFTTEERRLDELDLPEEGVLVLGIQRADGDFVGAPRGRSVIHPHDTLILYRLTDRLAEIEARVSGPGGDAAHRDAVLAQQEIFAEQDRRDVALHHTPRRAVTA